VRIEPIADAGIAQLAIHAHWEGMQQMSEGVSEGVASASAAGWHCI